MTYSDKLKDPRWQKKRLEVFQRDDFTCVACGAKDKQLHAHHCYYVSGREPWEYGDRAIKTLCSQCHDVAHLNSKDTMNQEEWERWCVVKDVCNEFESLDNWASSDFYCAVTRGKNRISSTTLIIGTCHFLSEDPNRPVSADGKLTDPTIKSARLNLFHEAGMAGVFTDDFVREMVRKTRELIEESKARRADK